MLEIPITAKIVPLVIAGMMVVASPVELVKNTIHTVVEQWRNTSEEDQSKAWYNGGSGPIQWEGKIYEKPSEMGLFRGRVSKLTVKKDGKTIVHYDRGWDISPKTDEDAQILSDVLETIEKQGIGKNK